jgi:hypothetical protein
MPENTEGVGFHRMGNRPVTDSWAGKREQELDEENLGRTCAKVEPKTRLTDAGVLAKIREVKTKATQAKLKILNGKSWLGSATVAEEGAQKLDQRNHNEQHNFSNLAHRIEETNNIKQGAKQIFSFKSNKIHIKHGGH